MVMPIYLVIGVKKRWKRIYDRVFLKKPPPTDSVGIFHKVV